VPKPSNQWMTCGSKSSDDIEGISHLQVVCCSPESLCGARCFRMTAHNRSWFGLHVSADPRSELFADGQGPVRSQGAGLFRAAACASRRSRFPPTASAGIAPSFIQNPVSRRIFAAAGRKLKKYLCNLGFSAQAVLILRSDGKNGTSILWGRRQVPER